MVHQAKALTYTVIHQIIKLIFVKYDFAPLTSTGFQRKEFKMDSNCKMLWRSVNLEKEFLMW